MIIEEYYKSIKREFTAECLVETNIHKPGKCYNVITFAKPESYIYVEDENKYQHLTFQSFYEFLEKFKIC